MIEKLMTLFLLTISLIYLYCACQYSFGFLQSPGAGFLPIIVGIIAVILCALLLFKQWKSSPTFSADKIDWTKFLFLLIGLVVYLAILQIVGYCLASFILLFYLCKIYDTKNGLQHCLVWSVSGSLTFYFLFVYVLHVPLP